MADYRIISADSHVGHPNNLYDRLPAEYSDRRPRTEKIDGQDWLIIDNQPNQPIEAPGELTEEDKRKEFRQQDLEGDDYYDGTNIVTRLSDLKEDGVEGEVIYPNGIFGCFASPDPGYQMALAQLYNDYYQEIFGDAPDMFLPSAVVPTIDIQAATKEVERVGNAGYRSISVPVSRPAVPYNHRDYNPLWTAAERSNIPVSFHVFTESDPKEKSAEKNRDETAIDGFDTMLMVAGMAEAMGPMLALCASGTLERHSDLKFVLVECGTGWLAWALYAMDDNFVQRHMWQSPKLELKPSEYFQRQGNITFGNDPVGLHNIRFTGADCMMWGSDYPHDEGTFPHSREVIEETFEELTEEDKRKIVYDNAARLYGFSPNGA